ncbi:MAG TPA: FkbM family methyltransferase, partial [Phormidium sp.]
VVDSASFVSMYDEIFQKEIYKFTCDHESPLIVDCGSNIGLSIIYFKKIFPHSKILAFEPDRKVFQVLNSNIASFDFTNIKVINKAVWHSETTLEFMSEGADGGRVVETDGQNFSKYSVETVRLRDYLQGAVDFLKIDIEGAEIEVLQDCKDLLHNVSNLFIEYHSFVDRPQAIHLLTSILFEAGFRVHIHPSIISPHPFVSRIIHMEMDMQLNVFAYRDNL